MGWSNGLYRERVPEEHQHTMDITELDLGGIKHNEIEKLTQKQIENLKTLLISFCIIIYYINHLIFKI